MFAKLPYNASEFSFQSISTKAAMSDLFARQPEAPLAERLRPHSLDDVIGQQHLIGEGKPLRVAVEGGKPHSMLLWGAAGRRQNHSGTDFGAEL